MTTLLGLDVGERRIGVAIAELDATVARPLVTLRRDRDPAVDAAALQTLIDRHDVDAIVVGLPYEAAGQEGSQAAATRAWVEAIRPHLVPGPSITFQDERRSSHLAETRLGPMKRGRSGGPPTRAQRDAYRSRVDREAAAIILQDALDTRTAPDASIPRPQSSTETPA